MNMQPTEWAHQTQQSEQYERQRNIQLVKEYGKYPWNQTKEEEIGNPPEKELKKKNDSEDDPKSWEQNRVTDKQIRGKDWEDIRNI